MKFKIVEGWYDELNWCPSQCYFDFSLDEEEFQIYLRWRHMDPWKAHLIKLGSSQEGDKWFDLDIPYFQQHEDLKKIKNVALIKSIFLIKEEKLYL